MRETVHKLRYLLGIISTYMIVKSQNTEYYLHCMELALRYLFQVVQTQTTTAYCRILPTLELALRYLFQVVQTQTTTAYCRILPTLELALRYLFQVVQTQTTTAYCRIPSAHCTSCFILTIESLRSTTRQLNDAV
jgi:RimJ/RimL family protein N-acetyltransferase